MKIELRYFSGTGNSWTVLNTCYKIFKEAKHEVSIKALDITEKSIEADLIGFAFPIHAFGLPDIIRKYIRFLPEFKHKQKVFILMTAGDVIGSCSAAQRIETLLIPKNAVTIASEVIKMPNNWITFSSTQEKEINEGMINAGVEKAKIIALKVMNNEISKFDIKRIPVFFRYLGNTINILFRSSGRKQLTRLFSTYDTCNGCGLCAQTCPTNSIEIINNKPKWLKSCAQCMRCVNICPQEAIFQKMGGHTKLKEKYLAPGFPINN